MTDAVHIVPKLLLLFLLQTGSDRIDFPLSADSSYDITFSCRVDIVCFYLWNFNTDNAGDYVGIVSNGEIGTSDDSKCKLSFQDLKVTERLTGQHYCRKESGVFKKYSNATVLKPTPEKSVSLQCVLLTYVKHNNCYTQRSQAVTVTWVDESGAEIEEDSQHQIQRLSSCAVTLHISLQSSQKKKRRLRCQLTAGGGVQTSVELGVRFPGGSQRILVEPENQEPNQSVIGASVGAVGFVLSAALLAAFVVHRRRSNVQPSDESLNAVNASSGDDKNDVIYAGIMFPVDSGREWAKESESTEYSSVKYKKK